LGAFNFLLPQTHTVLTAHQYDAQIIWTTLSVDHVTDQSEASFRATTAKRQDASGATPIGKN